MKSIGVYMAWGASLFPVSNMSQTHMALFTKGKIKGENIKFVDLCLSHTHSVCVCVCVCELVLLLAFVV